MRETTKFRRFAILVALVAASIVFVFSGVSRGLDANTLHWCGRTWTITDGGMAGVAKGSPANVSVDGNGHLHMRIVNRGGTYTESEVFTTQTLGFGTYQWQIEGAVDQMDPTTVLGLFNYGAKAGVGVDAENEIDIEFSRWNNTCKGCNADFTFYPATGNKALGPMEDNFIYDPKGSTLTTARFEWSSKRIVATIMSGLQPLGTTTNVLQTLTFEPTDYSARIPQVPLPLGINLWCFRATPSADQEVVIRKFEFVGEQAGTGSAASQ